MDLLVTVYSKALCVQCDATKRKLRELGIPFDEIRVDEDLDALDRIKNMGYLQAPVVTLSDGQSWSGYRPGKIAQIKEGI